MKSIHGVGDQFMSHKLHFEKVIICKFIKSNHKISNTLFVQHKVQFVCIYLFNQLHQAEIYIIGNYIYYKIVLSKTNCIT